MQLHSTNVIAFGSSLLKMITWRGVHPATLASVLLETKCLCDDGTYTTAQTATGFLYRNAGRTFLITNWHVVTGRNPDSPLEMLITARDSPVRLDLWMPRKVNRHYFLPETIELYHNGQPTWYEPTDTNGRVDIVALQINFSDDVHVVTVQDFAQVGGQLSVGDDVVIVGFPFGRYEQNPHSIWKKAMVAFEPGILLSGRPRFFVDVAGREGMSGSPVYATDAGHLMTGSAAAALNNPSLSALQKINAVSESNFIGKANVLRFIGVYSGALKENKLRDLNMGFCWHGGLVESVVNDLIPGHNPEVPRLSVEQ